MAIWTSRYSNKELVENKDKYYCVGISLGTPKFPLGYTVEQQCYSLAPKHFWRIAMILAPSLKIWRISRTRIQGKARLSGRLLMRCWFTRQQSTSAILFLITALEMRWFRS